MAKKKQQQLKQEMQCLRTQGRGQQLKSCANKRIECS